MGWMADRIDAARVIAQRVIDHAVALIFAAVILIEAAAQAHLVGPLTHHPIVLFMIIGSMIFFLQHNVARSQDRLTENVAAAHADLTAKVAGETQAMQKVTNRIEDTQRGIDAGLRQQSTNLALMRETLQSEGKLWSLEGAIDDLKELVDGADRGDTLRIDHLGLTMTNAWDKLCPAVKEFVQQRPVELRLLILRDGAAGAFTPADGGIPLPETVEKWLTGEDKLEEIKQSLADIQKTAAADAGVGSLAFDVRTYRDVPVVHGIRISGPFDAAYVSFCRWDKSKSPHYWWGAHQYHRVLGDDSPERKDLLDILEGYFERWWLRNQPPRGRAAGRKAAAAA